MCGQQWHRVLGRITTAGKHSTPHIHGGSCTISEAAVHPPFRDAGVHSEHYLHHATAIDSTRPYHKLLLERCQYPMSLFALFSFLLASSGVPGGICRIRIM